MVERHGVDYHEKTLGQLFCDESSKEILRVLLTEADWAGVSIQTETTVEALEDQDGGFFIENQQR